MRHSDDSTTLGEYPKPLLNAWNVFKKNHGKDALNESPNEYSSSSQLYMAIALANGGTDLEKFKVSFFDTLELFVLDSKRGRSALYHTSSNYGLTCCRERA